LEKGGKMAEFSGFILTNKGRELLAKAVAGATLTFTRIGFGDGLYEGDKKEAEELAGLKNKFFINQIKKTGTGQVSLKTIITNRNVETGYYIREIGIYAVCENEEEVLYAYNSATEADYLPAFNDNNLIELEYQNYIVIDQAEKVTAVIDPSATYLTKEEAEEIYVPQTQVATETTKGIVSLNDVRVLEAASVLGAEYGGVFGDKLKNIVANKTYYYWDNNRKIYIPYLALKNGVNQNGFLVPDSINFSNISNSEFDILSKKVGSFMYRIYKKANVIEATRIDTFNEPTIWEVIVQVSTFLAENGYTHYNEGFTSNFFGSLNNSKILSCYTIYNILSGWRCYGGEGNIAIDMNIWKFHSGYLKMEIKKK
jgi:hypothetical protein